MKYSFWMDMWLTALLWYVLGLTFVGFLIAVTVGTLLTIKVCTFWHHVGGLRWLFNRTGKVAR